MAHKNIFNYSVLPILLLLLAPVMSRASIVVLNGLTHLHDVVPGETYRGVIEIQNTKDGEQTVKLYQRDYFFRYTGEAFYEEPGSQDRSNAAWIDISPTYFVLKAKEKRSVSYEIKVPDDAELNGTFWSVIMVEGVAPISENDLKKGLNVRTQIRYAVQVATTFNKEGNRNLTFYDVAVVKEDGQTYLAVDIENKGDFLFRPDVSVEIFNGEGQSLGVFTAVKKKIYPETSARFLMEIEGIGTGNYQVLVLADCGDEDVFGINLPLEITDD
ncbi:MAG TPA: hypothetical protein ENJ95_24460 [Bacteroidetes bacterium]|nr:hypothetical protein [Bacteroidota bacterium]